MCSYRGNVGHLMQHWTLCEMLTVASNCVAGLNYIDAHAMAPWATIRTGPSREFDYVRDRLPGEGSAYERAWHRIKNLHLTEGYPSSAAFVREVWKNDYSLLLCDRHQATADKIDEWLSKVRQETNCKMTEPFRGDWRDRFEKGLPGPTDVDLPGDSLTLVSFDPNVCSRSLHRRNPIDSPWNLYPQDLKLALSALSAVKSGILIQLSTYSVNGNNPQNAVIESADGILTPCGFQRVAVVRVHRSMMSLVYARHVEWGNKLWGLSEGFDKWRSPQR